MPALDNEKYETFCQHVAAGLTGAEAYRLSGGAPKAAANGAYTWMKRQEIRDRIAELKAAIADQVQATATERRAAVEAEVKIEAEVRNRVRKLQVNEQPTRKWVLSQLAENVEAAKEKGDRNSVNRALELIGKEIGLFVERKMDVKSPLEGLDANQLMGAPCSTSPKGCPAARRSPWRPRPPPPCPRRRPSSAPTPRR